MALGMSVAADIANLALTYFTRGKVFAQTIQEKPLIAALNGAKKSFGGGKDNVSDPVQGVYMSDTAGFFAGYTEDDQLTFKQAANALRAAYAWKEVHAGLWITWTELKKDGISIVDDTKGGSVSQHSDVELTRLTGILENRLEDYAESWARQFNNMLWKDGSQDAKQTPGVKSILTETPDSGTTGGLDRATYTWWRHRRAANLTFSEANQTLSKKMRSELRQLRRYGGRPSLALCGSAFIEALEAEVQAKGIYTQEGFTNEGKTDMGMAKIRMRGLGTFEYDPSLDDYGDEKACYVIDTRKLQLRPMEGEENKTLNPERPYDYAVFIKSMTWTGAITCKHLNSCGVYRLA